MKVGSAIKETLAAVGIPACGGCQKRAEWFDKVFDNSKDGFICSCLVKGKKVILSHKDNYFTITSDFSTLVVSEYSEAKRQWEELCR